MCWHTILLVGNHSGYGKPLKQRGLLSRQGGHCTLLETGIGNMTTERQKAANQANARRSTGPQTQRGKAVVRLNALQHGLLARDVVLPGESADAFEELLSRVRAEFAPVGPIEELVVDRLVKIIARLCRLDRVETALFDCRFGHPAWVRKVPRT